MDGLASPTASAALQLRLRFASLRMNVHDYFFAFFFPCFAGFSVFS